MDIVHYSVLKEEVYSFLEPGKDDRLLIDCTLGEGGHSELFLSRCPWINLVGLDADDKICITYLEKAIDIIKKNKKLKVVYCEAVQFGNVNKKWMLPKFSYKRLLVKNMIFCSALFRKKDYEMVGGYTNGILFEDWDLWLKIINNDNQVYQIPETLFYYRKHNNNSLMDILAKKDDIYNKSLDVIFKKNQNSFLKDVGNPFDIEQQRRELLLKLNSNKYLFFDKISNTIIFKIIYKFFK